MGQQDTRRPVRGIGRRRLVAGAAWTTPVVLAAAPAPAFAASCVQTFTGPNAAGWTVANTNMSTNGGTNGFLTNGYRVVADPASSAAASVVVSTITPVAFQAGTTYTFTFAYTAYVQNTRKLTFTLLVNNQQVGGSTVATPGSGTAGNRTATYTPTATGCYVVALSFVFGTENSSVGDDIDITNLARSPA